ncbi:MAG: hypothetical protein HYW14_01425 [Planctomycetes bacterium]|nr:hypothetical protein [Planctomycetota bacterium]
MITQINESVKVAVIFGNGRKIKPVWFEWNGRQHRIQSVTYVWNSKKGKAVIYHFSVTEGENLYELRYNTETSEWELAQVETEG